MRHKNHERQESCNHGWRAMVKKVFKNDVHASAQGSWKFPDAVILLHREEGSCRADVQGLFVILHATGRWMPCHRHSGYTFASRDGGVATESVIAQLRPTKTHVEGCMRVAVAILAKEPKQRLWSCPLPCVWNPSLSSSIFCAGGGKRGEEVIYK